MYGGHAACRKCRDALATGSHKPFSSAAALSSIGRVASEIHRDSRLQNLDMTDNASDSQEDVVVGT